GIRPKPGAHRRGRATQKIAPLLRPRLRVRSSSKHADPSADAASNPTSLRYAPEFRLACGSCRLFGRLESSPGLLSGLCLPDMPVWQLCAEAVRAWNLTLK